MEIINVVIKELAGARHDAAQLKAELSALLDMFRNTNEYITLESKAKQAAEHAELLENRVREMAVSQYIETQNKKPHEAATIKLFTVVSITDEPAAREWCFANFRPALKLDTKVFEKAAKDGTAPAELVTVEEQPRAQIATDLSKYL